MEDKFEYPDNMNESRKEEQKKTVERILSAFKEGKKYVMLSAPTGSGKSWIATILGLNHHKKTFILTKQKSLQEQYAKEFPFIYSVKGKGNFDCIQHFCEEKCTEGDCNTCNLTREKEDFQITRSKKNERITLKDDEEFLHSDTTIKKITDNYTMSELIRIPTKVPTEEAGKLVKKQENLIQIDKTQWFLFKWKDPDSGEEKIYWANEDDQIPKTSEILRDRHNDKKTGTLDDYLPDNNEGGDYDVPYILKSPICPYWYQRRLGEKATISVWNYKSFLSTQLSDFNEELEKNKKERIEVDPERLLICDETHALEDELVDHYTIEINLYLISKVLKNQRLHDDLEAIMKERSYDKIYDYCNQAKEKISALLDKKKKHNDCLKYLRKNSHIQKHRDELGCKCRHKTIRSNCEECGKLRKFRKNNEHLKCTKHLYNEVNEKGESLCPERSETHETFTIKNIRDIINAKNNLNDNLKLIDEIKTKQEEKFDLEEHFVMTQDSQKKILKLEPLKIGIQAQKLFDHFKNVIFMSSTIHEELFRNEMSLEKDEYEYIRIKNPIDKDDRVVYHNSGTKVEKWDKLHKETTIKKITDKISKIMTHRPDKKGIILTNSYPDVKIISEHLRKIDPDSYKRLTKKFDNNNETSTDEGEEKSNEKLLYEHKIKPNSVLLSPSMWEGVDLKGSDGEFVIIATAPIMPQTEKRNPRAAAKKRYATEQDNQWWIMRNAFKLLQGTGRCSRSKGDKSEIFILDDGCNADNTNLIDWLKEQDERTKYKYADSFVDCKGIMPN